MVPFMIYTLLTLSRLMMEAYSEDPVRPVAALLLISKLNVAAHGVTIK